MLWSMKTYVPAMLKYYACRVAIGTKSMQQQRRSRTPSGPPSHPLPVPCHLTHFFLDNLYSTFFIPCKTSFLSPLIPVSTALQWNLSFFYSPKKCNRKRLESGQQKWHTERQNNSCGDCVKADIRTIFIPFLLTESPASGLVLFAFMLGKNYHLKEHCLLAHFKIPSYWQARIEMS